MRLCGVLLWRQGGSPEGLGRDNDRIRPEQKKSPGWLWHEKAVRRENGPRVRRPPEEAERLK